MLIWPISLPLFTHWLRIFSHLFSFVVPLLVLYGLKHCLPRLWSTFVFTSNQNQNEENNRKSNEKMKLNRNYYGFLVYVTFILSCHITIIETAKRLISAFVIVIFEMSRLNSSCFIRRWESSDSSYMAYLSYLHMEKTYRIPTEISPEPNDIVVDNNENDYSSIRSDTQRPIQSNDDDNWDASIIGRSRIGSQSSFAKEQYSDSSSGVKSVITTSQQIDSRNLSLSRAALKILLRSPLNSEKDSPQVKMRHKREADF
ncbi:unnamed protein product [Adineta ricciae]|nr:unnamed protein product [Adineta ricciae]